MLANDVIVFENEEIAVDTYFYLPRLARRRFLAPNGVFMAMTSTVRFHLSKPDVAVILPYAISAILGDKERTFSFET